MLSMKVYETYQIGKYTYEIERTRETTEIWIYRKDFGIKQFIIGIPEKWNDQDIINYIRETHQKNRWGYICDVEDK